MTLIRTGMLTVNAAFLQDLKDDNVHLRELLATVNDVLSHVSYRSIHAGAFAELLSRLRDQLATHFALEECFGYFDDAVEVASRFSTQADIIQAQHASLFSEICEIVDEVECLAYGEPNACPMSFIVERYRLFHRVLEAHENGERELIMAALNEDIGVGD